MIVELALLLLLYVLPVVLAIRMSGLLDGALVGMSRGNQAFELMLVFCPLVNFAMVGAVLYMDWTRK